MSNNEKYVCFNCVEYESWITKRDAEIERLRKELKLVSEDHAMRKEEYVDSRREWEAKIADNQLAAYIDGLRAYAWWKDGTEYVGCGNYTLEQAIARAMEESIRLWRRL